MRERSSRSEKCRRLQTGMLQGDRGAAGSARQLPAVQPAPGRSALTCSRRARGWACRAGTAGPGCAARRPTEPAAPGRTDSSRRQRGRSAKIHGTHTRTGHLENTAGVGGCCWPSLQRPQHARARNTSNGQCSQSAPHLTPPRLPLERQAPLLESPLVPTHRPAPNSNPPQAHLPPTRPPPWAPTPPSPLPPASWAILAFTPGSPPVPGALVPTHHPPFHPHPPAHSHLLPERLVDGGGLHAQRLHPVDVVLLLRQRVGRGLAVLQGACVRARGD